MKRIKKIIVCLFAVLLLCGCSGVNTVDEGNKANNNVKSMFIQVEYAGMWKVVYHRETKVMYAVSDGLYNHGTFTLLVNADGTPMLYEG